MSEQQPRLDATDGLADISARDREIGRAAAAEKDRQLDALAARIRSDAPAHDVLGDRAPIARADEIRDEDALHTAERQEVLANDSASAAEMLRRNAETVRRTGENIRQVRERLQSTADRVQALRDAARTLGDDIARTVDAVEPPEDRRGT